MITASRSISESRWRRVGRWSAIQSTIPKTASKIALKLRTNPLDLGAEQRHDRYGKRSDPVLPAFAAADRYCTSLKIDVFHAQRHALGHA
jgi:hypothetical protein